MKQLLKKFMKKIRIMIFFRQFKIFIGIKGLLKLQNK